MNRKLPRSFYDRPTLEVARDILGKSMIFNSASGRLSARIVEVEAYIGQDDPACHAAPGPTRRNRVMFGRPGFSYVYFVYGMYHCFNIVTEAEGLPAAVLVRAAEPTAGLEIMQSHSPKAKGATILSGPGKFCRAFGLTTEHSGLDLTGDTLYLRGAETAASEIVTTGRVGIKKAAERPYRFYLAESAAVSGPRTLRKVAK